MHSAYNSLVWLVKKADRRWHLTIDYQMLSANMRHFIPAVPNIANLTATLYVQASAHKLMPVLDIKYWVLWDTREIVFLDFL